MTMTPEHRHHPEYPTTTILSIVCEGLSLSDPLDTSDPADSEEDEAVNRLCHKCFTRFRTTKIPLLSQNPGFPHYVGYHEIAGEFAHLLELRQYCCELSMLQGHYYLENRGCSRQTLLYRSFFCRFSTSILSARAVKQSLGPRMNIR